VSLINPDGTVHTPKWIGATRDGLTLNDPLGSDIVNGRFYVVDANVVRWFDMTSGAPIGSAAVAGATGFQRHRGRRGRHRLHEPDGRGGRVGAATDLGSCPTVLAPSSSTALR
jgi:hypothetical protein